MRSQETFNYTFQGFNISNFEFTAFMFVLSLLLCLFLLWHLAEVNCEFSLSCNSYFWVSTVFLYPQLFRHFLGNPQYRKRINLKGWELRTKQPSSIFCHECIHSASLEFYGNIIKAVQYSCSCWYSAKYYSRILQVELCCHIHLTQSKFCCSFCSNVCSGRALQEPQSLLAKRKTALRNLSEQ